MPDGFTGVDLGIINIATTSDGTNHSGKHEALPRRARGAVGRCAHRLRVREQMSAELRREATI
ncbi:hypothetical protein [Actinomadura bangladeshensis]|uniref:hypothetical protein n=1 Tax=Actinomadura bangladeshensis TaxID=453573 RepID=UPI001A9E04D8|nr:hypothetical protein [Actinomadura bangladeshensis]